jgi:predicted nucleic acid-binding protein
VSILVDTCVISETIKKKPDPKVLAWCEAHQSDLRLCHFTIAEIQRGICALAKGAARTRLEAWFQDALVPTFAEDLLPFDFACACRWGPLIAAAEAQGKNLKTMDSLIAAVALGHGMALATRNTNDFTGLGIDLVDPWAVVV